MSQEKNVRLGSKTVFDLIQKHFLASGKQDFASATMFPKWPNYETFASATMFPSLARPLHVPSVCTPCFMLLLVIGSCCTKFETFQTFEPTTVNISFVP